MITYSNENHTILMSMHNEIRVELENGSIKYKVVMPSVYCDNESQARFIQIKVNELVTQLGKDLLNLEEGMI